MKDAIIKAAATEFADSKRTDFSKSYLVKESPTEIITVTYERRKLQIANESRKFEAQANTISALPSGANCSCCGGSGRG
jgi:hypothetical protein